MKYSVVVMYIPNFIKIDSAIQKLMVGRVHRQQRLFISLLLFYKNKEMKLKNRCLE
jgi:hypothetical protein